MDVICSGCMKEDTLVHSVEITKVTKVNKFDMGTNEIELGEVVLEENNGFSQEYVYCDECGWELLVDSNWTWL